MFDEHPQHGVRLIEAGLGVWRLWLSEALGVGESAVHVYRRTSSTQDRARESASRPGAAPPLLVVADEQTAGRGRLGRTWTAPSGSSILMTLILPAASVPGAGSDPVTAYAAVALLEAVRRVAGVEALLKWPNDAVLGGGKLAGILVERFDAGGERLCLIGIGINVNRPAPGGSTGEAEGGGSAARAWLSDAAGRRIDRLSLLTETARRVRAWATHPDPGEALERWRRSCTTLGVRRRFRCEGRELVGDVLDVDLDAGLIVRVDSGELVHLPASRTTVL